MTEKPLNRLDQHTATLTTLNPNDIETPGERRMWTRALTAGVAGAVLVTLLNESARRTVPHAPRMEVIGERALARGLASVDITPPRGRRLYFWTLAGDLLSNSAYYSLVGILGARRAGDGPWRGALLGLLAGIGGAVLPEPLGLGRQPNAKRGVTSLLTVTWYLLGGLAAGTVYDRTAASKARAK